ncbi:MAG: phosphotransferase [Pseudomonadota bacterium]
MAQNMVAFNLNGIAVEGISTGQTRLAQVVAWLEAVMPEPPLKLTVASADASFRQYYRAHTSSASYIVMDAPVALEPTRPFFVLAKRLRAAGVSAPRVYEWNEADGMMLLEDFGRTTLLTHLGHPADGATLSAAERRVYERALDDLLVLQRAPSADLPPFDEAYLREEMALFRIWLIDRHLSLSWSLSDDRLWRSVQRQLVDDALSQPRAFVHRDYHSRNLMIRNAREDAAELSIGVIDFQDAMYGPVLYDCVSLLKDCYVRLSYDDQHHLLDYFVSRAQQGLQDDSLTRKQFAAMGIQRHLKAAGIFARLWHRDGKAGYLNDLPRTVFYLLEAAQSIPTYHRFGQWIEERVWPRLDRGTR